MDQSPTNKDSRLLPILREGIAVIQMIFFKEYKSVILRKFPDLDGNSQTMLAGAITNEIFGTHNQEEKFLTFRNKHQGTIEQELLCLCDEVPHLKDPLSDALRIQTLCDSQDGISSEHVLKQANNFNILSQDRELPLPSTFMETVRTLGATHKLIIPPVEIDTAEEQNFLQ